MGSDGGIACVTGTSGFIGSWLIMLLLERGYVNEVIKPTINGVLSIMKACAKAETVKKMYFFSKTMAEQAAWKFAKENNIDFVSIIPPLVAGPFIMQSMPPSLITALSPITGNEAHYSIIKHGQFVHLDDLCRAHIFLFENPKAEGRYICASHHATILDIAKMLREKYPDYNVPSELKDVNESLKSVEFSSKKLTDLGFEFKFSLEDFTGAAETCREKGLLSLSNEKKFDINQKMHCLAMIAIVLHLRLWKIRI